MKGLLLLVAFIFAINSFGQVGVGTPSPAPSAMLEVKSSNKGFLPPRLTTSEIMAIEAPEAGLMVYNKNTNKPCYYNGTCWRYFDTSCVLPELGKLWQEGGGVVIYVNDSGNHGLIAAPVNQGYAMYGCAGTQIKDAQNSAVGAGQANTLAILAACNLPGIAALLCDNLELNGRDDWFLPSRGELLLMYQQRDKLKDIESSLYVSSTQANPNGAWMIDFTDGSASNIPSTSPRNVRAVRAF